MAVRWPRRSPSGNKFNARKTVVDGITFDSAKEARRYQELSLLEKAGEIAQFEIQPRYSLLASPWTPAGGISVVKIGSYTPDFRIVYASGEIVIEDVKSEPSKTTAYRLRKRIFEANYWPLTITEV